VRRQAFEVASDYARSISCTTLTEEKYLMALVPWRNFEDLGERGEGKYALIWSGDIDCDGGSHAATTNIAIVRIGAGTSFKVAPELSSPMITFDARLGLYDVVIVACDELMAWQLELGPHDPMCCPSVPVRIRLKEDEKGNWNCIERMRLRESTAPEGQEAALVDAARTGDLKQTLAHLAWGADPNSRGGYIFTPLMAAARGGHTEVVKALLAAGAEVNTRTDDNWTPLMLACGLGRNSVVPPLLKKGADVNVRGLKGETALMLAAAQRSPDIVRALLDKGADIDAKDIYGQNALTWAASQANPTAVKLLRDRGAEMTLIAASYLGDTKQIRLLSKEGAYINSKDRSGKTPLMAAVWGGHTRAAQLLLEKNADIDAKDDSGYTALMHAVLREHPGVVKLLLEKGADMTARDIYGRTAFGAYDQETLGPNREIVYLLEAYGAE
jgi:ankyrin repeat protein